jgi:hypothetical protein
MDIDMAIKAILVGIDSAVGRIVTGYLMTLQTELFRFFFQQIDERRTMRIMTINTTAVFRSKIAGGFVFVNEWAIHFAMAFVTCLIFHFGSQISACGFEVIVTIGTVNRSRHNRMLALQCKLMFLFAMTIKAGFIDGLTGKSRAKVRFSIMYLMTAKTIHAGFEMFAGMGVIGLRFTEMALAANVECLNCR